MPASSSSDGSLPRCGWVPAPGARDPIGRELMTAYHDHEWGQAQHDDRVLFELLVLEGFQAGLSWMTVLKKRQNFRRAFFEWNVPEIARLTDRRIEKLLQDPGIIRNRQKVEATRSNARSFLAVAEEFCTFDAYLWRFTDGETLRPARRYKDWRDVPCDSPLAHAMSKDLKARGFRFVGPVICYSYMQACGLVDDHTANCFRAKEHS